MVVPTVSSNVRVSIRGLQQWELLVKEHKLPVTR